jgi:hypothetical protein
MASIVIGCVAFGTYLLFAGTISANELATAGVLAVLAAAWAGLIRTCSQARFGADGRHIAPALRALLRLAPGSGQAAAVLLGVIWRGGSPGRAQQSQFQFGAVDHRSARTRRALALLCASLAPDRFIVRLNRKQGLAITHSIVRGRRPDAEWLQ